MTDMMEYKGYLGSVHYSSEDHAFFGKLEFIRALVNYEATNVAELETNFKEAVDDYLEFCRRQHQHPEKPFKGSFNVRIRSELHRIAAIYAEEHGTSLNQVVEEALEHHLTNAGAT
jgi:predicted HicB family RNase H-like nuclease